MQPNAKVTCARLPTGLRTANSPRKLYTLAGNIKATDTVRCYLLALANATSILNRGEVCQTLVPVQSLFCLPLTFSRLGAPGIAHNGSLAYYKALLTSDPGQCVPGKKAHNL